MDCKSHVPSVRKASHPEVLVGWLKIDRDSRFWGAVRACTVKSITPVINSIYFTYLRLDSTARTYPLDLSPLHIDHYSIRRGIASVLLIILDGLKIASVVRNHFAVLSTLICPSEFGVQNQGALSPIPDISC